MAEIPVAGDKAPLFSLKNKDGKAFSLKEFAGKWVALYFYPKDDTPGCTQEAKDFTALLPEFRKNNAAVLGISPDSEKSHAGFIDKHGLAVELLSDPDHKVLESYGVWQKKMNYGKEYMGVARTTFLIDPEGVIRQVWEKVKVDDHAEDVKATLCKLR